PASQTRAPPLGCSDRVPKADSTPASLPPGHPAFPSPAASTCFAAPRLDPRWHAQPSAVPRATPPAFCPRRVGGGPTLEYRRPTATAYRPPSASACAAPPPSL